jgi:tRNA uridine 5-carboxymethylaminomethyl modification enzyme
VVTNARLNEQAAQELGFTPINQVQSAKDLLRRPEATYEKVQQLSARIVASTEASERVQPLPEVDQEIATEVELQVRYENFVQKQEQQVLRTAKMENLRIPEYVDYEKVPHLRTQARQKLLQTMPRTVGQASRVEGVTPADIAILMVYIEKSRAIQA